MRLLAIPARAAKFLVTAAGLILCLACHGPTKTASAAPVAAARTCPGAKANCTSCHMPKVELPGGNARFTDHFIRVVKPGEPYPD